MVLVDEFHVLWVGLCVRNIFALKTRGAVSRLVSRCFVCDGVVPTPGGATLCVENLSGDLEIELAGLV